MSKNSSSFAQSPSSDVNVRVLFDHPFPFALAHGGFQTQIEQTKLALNGIGIETDFIRWWDDKQQGNIIHYFGRPLSSYIEQAHAREMKVVLAELLTATGSRLRPALLAQRMLISLSRRILPVAFTVRLAWDSYQVADAIIANTPWEAKLMSNLFGAPKDRLHIVPNGVEETFLHSASVPRGPWLVCAATITERKRVLELAEAAVRAQVPIWIIGKPYTNSALYAERFLKFTNANREWIRYEGPIHDRHRLARIYREARGFVLLSAMETLSLSADEAAACECPLLLSDLPWARTVFGEGASYCPITSTTAHTAACLKRFYEGAQQRQPPRKPKTWIEVGHQLKSVYERLLSASR